MDAEVDALVNTVNTVGVMGKGIALMFKEAFPENYRAYADACKKNEVKLGKMFVTNRAALEGPQWIINFPTKAHWRYPSKLKWIVDGLHDLKRIISDKKLKSVALPPLGAGSGKLDWPHVKREIELVMRDLEDVDVVVYEPAAEYQNVAKRHGTRKLTIPRALIAELVRRYWILGIECSMIEIQKLAWFLERNVGLQNLPPVLDFRFVAHNYGPFSDRLRHLLDSLDGSYLHCERRLSDALPSDVIWFDDRQIERIRLYLNTEGKSYLGALEATTELIDGFESPLSLELLATVDWLIYKDHCEPSLSGIKTGLTNWLGGGAPARRKLSLFNDRLIDIALERGKTIFTAKGSRGRM